MNSNNLSELKSPIAVLGAGNGGLAMAGHLSLMGFEVRLFNRSEERLWGVKSTGEIDVVGEIEGHGNISVATTSMEEAIEGVELIMIVVPATAHKWMAKNIAPYLKDGQIIVLHPGRTFGALEFKQVLVSNGVTADVIITVLSLIKSGRFEATSISFVISISADEIPCVSNKS